MKTGLAETQFSIYKVDFDAVDEHFKIKVARDFEISSLRAIVWELELSTCRKVDLTSGRSYDGRSDERSRQ